MYCCRLRFLCICYIDIQRWIIRPPSTRDHSVIFFPHVVQTLPCTEEFFGIETIDFIHKVRGTTSIYIKIIALHNKSYSNNNACSIVHTLNVSLASCLPVTICTDITWYVRVICLVWLWIVIEEECIRLNWLKRSVSLLNMFYVNHVDEKDCKSYVVFRVLETLSISEGRNCAPFCDAVRCHLPARLATYLKYYLRNSCRRNFWLIYVSCNWKDK